MHLLTAIALAIFAQTGDTATSAPVEPAAVVQDGGATTDAPPEPAAVVQDEGAAYIEESLRQSIERARELSRTKGVEWPGMTQENGPSLSGETQSRLVLERMRAAKLPAARMRALEGWMAAKTWDTPDVLIEALVDPEPRIAAYAARALTQIAGEQEAVAGLLHRYIIEQLLSDNVRIRVGIQRALPTLRPVLEAPMLRTVQSPEEEAPRRAAAAYCLGEMGGVLAIEALARGAWAEEPVFARTCAEALLKLHHPRNAATWMQLLKHNQLPVRKAAVNGLSMTGGPGAGEALVGIALGNGEGEVELRLMAVRALSRWPVYESLPLLIRLLDGRPGVRNTAHAMLQRRTGMNFEAVPQIWRTWWEEYGRYGVSGPQAAEETTVRAKPMFDLEYLSPGGGPPVEGNVEILPLEEEATGGELQ